MIKGSRIHEDIAVATGSLLGRKTNIARMIQQVSPLSISPPHFMFVYELITPILYLFILTEAEQRKWIQAFGFLLYSRR